MRDIRHGMYREETIMYADDVAVIADSITDIQEVAQMVVWNESKWNEGKHNKRKD